MAGSGSQPLLDDALVASREATTEVIAAARRKASANEAPKNTNDSATVEQTTAATDDATATSDPTRWQRWGSAARELLRSRSTPGFLISLILHTALLLALALITIAGPGRGGFSSGIFEAFATESADATVEMVDPMLASGAVADDASDSAQDESFMAAPGTQDNYRWFSGRRHSEPGSTCRHRFWRSIEDNSIRGRPAQRCSVQQYECIAGSRRCRRTQASITPQIGYGTRWLSRERSSRRVGIGVASQSSETQWQLEPGACREQMRRYLYASWFP